MLPIDEYQWCLKVLRFHFKLMRIDIFDKNYRYGIGFYLILTSWLTIDICYLSEMLDGYYDKTFRFNLATMVFGAVQVSAHTIGFKPNNYLQRF